MSFISLPYIFNNLSGNVPATDLDANFNAIAAIVNGGIDATNLAANFNPAMASLTVSGAASIGGTLNAGATTLSSLTVSGNETIDGNLNVIGNLTQTGGSAITGGNTTTGYTQFPNGLILNWGQPTTVSTFTYYFPFPNAAIGGIVCSMAGNDANFPYISSVTKTSCYIGSNSYNGGNWGSASGTPCQALIVGW